MRSKLQAITQWAQMPAGQYFDMDGKKRWVVIDFNVDRLTRLDVVKDGKVYFLAALQPGVGPTRVEFSVDGHCAIIPTTDGEVWFYTDDGDRVNFAVTTKSFTKLEQRMEMTPELEVTILKANIRLEQRRREVAELKLIQQQRDQAAAANADPETGEVDDETEVPVDADTGAAEPAAPAGTGEVSK